MRDPFAGYDAWLEAPFQRMCAEQEAEWEAYEEWCNEREKEMLDNPNEDADWQAYCVEQNRLIDESWGKYMEQQAEEELLAEGDRRYAALKEDGHGPHA